MWPRAAVWPGAAGGEYGATAAAAAAPRVVATERADGVAEGVAGSGAALAERLVLGAEGAEAAEAAMAVAAGAEAAGAEAAMVVDLRSVPSGVAQLGLLE